MEISTEIATTIARVLQEKHGFSTITDLDKAVAAIVAKSASKQANGRSQISLSKMIRGMRVISGQAPLNERTKDDDVTYVKALDTGTQPGSFLVPVLQADEIVEMLSTGGVLRSMGPRIWDMAGVQKMNVPVALSSPVWVWMAQNSIQTPTDPNLGQMAFNLLERRVLTSVPNQLLKTSVN